MNATKILIVDDQKVALQMLRSTLAPLRYVMEDANDGLAAVAKAKEFKPDLILLDLVMPGMDGIEAARLLKNDPQTATIPIIIITANTDRKNLLRAFGAGVDDYINKPFTSSELLSRVQTNLCKRDALALVEQEKTDARIILDLSLSIASTLNSKEILQTIVARVADHIKVKRCSIIRFSDDGHGLVLAANDDPSAKGIRIELARYPELQEMIRSREACTLRDAKNHPLLNEVREFMVDLDFDTILVIPIHLEQNIIGAIVLRTTAEKHLSAIASSVSVSQSLMPRQMP